MPQTEIIREGTLNPEQEKTAVYIPFTMPSDAVCVEVSYSYSNAISADPFVTGGNTLDIGIFDEKGTEFLDGGFRGWCGSERDRFYIALLDATPGFSPGAIHQGEWNIYLGLYKIGPSGCSYKIAIIIETGVESTLAPAVRSFPAHPLPADSPRAPFFPWLRGQLHCHSIHSDGDFSPADLVAFAVDQGLDFLAITDHNTVLAQRDLGSLAAPGLVLIRGLEVTTYSGHFNVWGIPDWVDFRVTRAFEMRQSLDYAHAHGALVSCNHPKPYGPPWEFQKVNNYDCIEAWNGPWNVRNPASLEFWLKQLAVGRRIPAVGGSDFHRPPKSASRSSIAGSATESTGKITERLLTNPTIWVHVPDQASESTILAAIRAGHVVLSEGVDGPLLDLRAGEDLEYLGGDEVNWPPEARLPVQIRCRNGQGGILRVLDQETILHEQEVTQGAEELDIAVDVHSRLYLRVELRGRQEEMRAMTNPIYRRHEWRSV